MATLITYWKITQNGILGNFMSNLDGIIVIRLILLLETTKKQTPKPPIVPKVLESGSKGL